MTLHEITQLASAGFTKAEILQLAGLTQQAPQQAPQQMPQQAPQPAYDRNVVAEVLAGLMKGYDLGGVAQAQYGQQGSEQKNQEVPYVPQLPNSVVEKQSADANMQAILAMSKPYQPATADSALAKLINGPEKGGK